MGGPEPPELTPATMSASGAAAGAFLGDGPPVPEADAAAASPPAGACEDPQAVASSDSSNGSSSGDNLIIRRDISTIEQGTRSQHDGIIECVALLHQVPDVTLPVAVLASPGERAWKGRIRPPFGDPCGVIEHAHSSQGLDQPQL